MVYYKSNKLDFIDLKFYLGDNIKLRYNKDQMFNTINKL